MRDILLLRFDAPLMSFGGTLVDHIGVSDEFPARSMLAGLLANALGFDHREAVRTQRLQERIRYAVRRDRAGTKIEDYQTVDLGQPFLREGWTTSRRAERRAGAKEHREGTHIRLRSYLADAVYTVAVALDPADEDPQISNLQAALAAPARPLFLGRKPCLPASPILVGRARAKSTREAVEQAPRIGARGDDGPLAAWWPTEEGAHADESRLIPVTDDRDWSNQIHSGRRFVVHSTVAPPEAGR